MKLPCMPLLRTSCTPDADHPATQNVAAVVLARGCECNRVTAAAAGGRCAPGCPATCQRNQLWRGRLRRCNTRADGRMQEPPLHQRQSPAPGFPLLGLLAPAALGDSGCQLLSGRLLPRNLRTQAAELRDVEAEARAGGAAACQGQPGGRRQACKRRHPRRKAMVPQGWRQSRCAYACRGHALSGDGHGANLCGRWAGRRRRRLSRLWPGSWAARDHDSANANADPPTVELAQAMRVYTLGLEPKWLQR